MDPMKLLTDRGYKNFDPVDSGGQANVYKSTKFDESANMDKTYAIKVAKINKTDQSLKLSKDQQLELSIICKLDHLNCIRVTEMFRTKDRLYIVMDFMPNGNIAAVVKKKGPLCEWNCKIWFPAIARAVKYLHEHKVAHRDLKLANVLLDVDLNPKLSDFGLSRFVKEESYLSKTWCGTPSHFPPEINKRIPYDPFKVDIWCCGMMLFIMINQDYPFDKRDKVAMIAKQMANDYHFRKDVEPKISPMVKDLIQWMFEPDAAQRPNIQAVCAHRWFPIIHEEAKHLAQPAPTEEKS